MSPIPRKTTPPPWVLSDKTISERAKEGEARDALDSLVLDLRTMVSDWGRRAECSECGCSTDLRAILRRYGFL
jgi:hypothetical protein